MIQRFLLVSVLAVCLSSRAQYIRLVVEGDSLFSSNNGLSNWTQMFSPGTPIFNNASGGDLLTNIIAEFPSQDAPLVCSNAAFILEGGTGDLGAGSSGTNFQYVPAAQVYSNALRVLSEATNAGYSNLFLCTVGPSSSIPPPAQDDNRKNYNTLVRSGTSNGYAVIDAAAWIGQTNDSTYFQYDGIHWTDEFEQWLGCLAIPDALGYTETHPVLTVTIANGLATVGWSGRAYATNTIYQASALSGPWTPAVSVVEGAAGPLSVSVPATNHQVFFRLETEHVDFPTFYTLIH